MRARYNDHDQSHVLAGLDENDDGKQQQQSKEKLWNQLDLIRVEDVRSLFESATNDARGSNNDGDISDEEPHPFTGKIGNVSSSSSNHRQTGLELIRNRLVACVLMAGGQGTRLGHDGPKGTYDLKLPSGLSIFGLICHRLRRIAHISGFDSEDDENSCSGVKVPPPPLYIMTSPMNDLETKKHFSDHNYFGLPSNSIYFFKQGTLPCLSATDGKILMETPTKVSSAPDGNGGVYPALHRSGALKDMERRNIKHVHLFSVDNVLIKPADPIFLGYCATRDDGKGADCGNKVVWKTDPIERVGVVAERGGRPCIVEYTEIGDVNARKIVPDDGFPGGERLAYGAANICNHYLSMNFLKNVVMPLCGVVNGGTENAVLGGMPMHVAHKKIPVWDPITSRTITPLSNNGIKLERFVFDIFPHCRNSNRTFAVLCVNRNDEFAPLKNGPGSANDCPETARVALSEQAEGWIRNAKHEKKNVKAVAAVRDARRTDYEVSEVHPLVSYAGEGLDKYIGKIGHSPFYIKDEKQ